MAAASGQLDELFRTVGAELYRRSARVMADEDRAGRAAETLFVRFVVHGRAHAPDARARWAWIYRVATNYGLQQLPDDARPGGEAPAPPAREPVSAMRALRRFDEATRNIVVLACLDGLPTSEIAEVLGLGAPLVERKLATATTAAPAGTSGATASGATGAHPSLFALDRDRAALAEHLSGCADCRGTVAAADEQLARFKRALTPETLERVTSAVRAERARVASGPGWKRAAWMLGAFIAITILAFVVARPRMPSRDVAPYRGPITASRAKAAGIQITVHRGVEILALEPGAALHVGDRLHFRVRAEGPRYLELHVRGPADETRIFPADGNQAALVSPGQAVDHDYLVQSAPPAAASNTGGNRIWIVALFSEHPFPLDVATGPEVEVVPVRVNVE